MLSPGANLLYKTRLTILLAIAAVLAAACGGSAPTPQGHEPLVVLPRDEAPHDTPVEWWYFNGLVSDSSGNEYSWHYVTFRSEPVNGAVPHLLQASLGDHSAGKHFTGEKTLLAQLEADPTGVDASVSGWKMRGDGESYELGFDVGGTALDLKAVSERPPVLHQGTGLVNLGPAGDTFYYTRSRLKVTGTISVGGAPEAVSGAAWMDHQWGEAVDQRVGWDWTGLQLDDGSDLMAVLVWDPVDRQPFAGYATFLSADGEVQHVQQEDVSITASSTWTSPDTGIVYPINWDLSIPPLELELTLLPVLRQSEFGDSEFIPAAYWEGEVRVSGTRAGQQVGGRGFVELVGYDPRQLEG